MRRHRTKTWLESRLVHLSTRRPISENPIVPRGRNCCHQNLGLRHVGKAYVVTGGTEMSVADIAETIGQAVGKSVEYVEIPTETWLEGLATAPFMNPHYLKHLERVAEEHRNGRFAGVTEVVETIGGHKPKSLETFVRENIEAFGGIAVPSGP